MSAFKILLLNDVRVFKNYILEIKKKPWKALLYLVYFAWIIAAASQVLRVDMGASNVSHITLKKNVLSVGIKSLVLIIFAYTLYSGSNEFKGVFSMGDVNFLFPSPLSSRWILAYSMVKRSLVSGLSSIFILFLLPTLKIFYGPLHLELVFYSLVGVIVLFTFLVPFSYLSFVLSSRFGLKQWLHYFLDAIGIFILGAFVYGAYTQGNLLQGLFWVFNHPIFPYIPIVGWSSELIGVCIFGKSALSTPFLVLQLLTFAMVSLLTILWAKDYYEDALPMAEKITKIKNMKKQGKNIHVSLSNLSKKKQRRVDVKEIGQGPWAFLWMQLVSNKRSSGSFLFQWKTLGALLISIVFASLFPDKSIDVYYIVAVAIAYVSFLLSMLVSIEDELKMKNIFILPGQPWKKILALNIVPMIKAFILVTCLLLPTGIIFQVSLLVLMTGIAFPLSMIILNLFSTVVIHILIPNSFDLKAFFPLIRLLSFLLFLIPPGIVGIIVGVMTQSLTLAFLVTALINISLSILCLAISDRIFYRLEIR